MEIVIHIDVLKMVIKEFKKKLQVILDYLCVLGIAGAGLASFIYLCYCVFMWLAVV